jgi:cellulose synthase/poly-beta-1,6-N-acetylglucosamine synthase-like glycosyltransferase
MIAGIGYFNTNLAFMTKTKKSPLLYLGIIFTWILLLSLFAAELLQVFYDAGVFSSTKNQFVAVLINSSAVLVVILMAYFWLNGLKDIFYTGVFWLVGDKSKLASINSENRSLGYQPKVDLIYTVCDDFDANSLEVSLLQDYPKWLLNFYILDDSKKPESRQEIDLFAQQNSLQVIRRNSSQGYKAGNINNWLNSDLEFGEFFVILDSDEIIPPNFVSESVGFFADSGVGIVQANHVATRTHTDFADLFGQGVASHWVTYQAMKERFGFLSLLGHGAMLRTSDVKAIGGFPEVVAEDLALSIKLAEIGKRVVFAKDIICEETYPVDYFAFKKRHAKWTMGNMEFIKKFSGLFLSKKLTWFEKVDILLFVYNLPLTVLFITFLLIHLVVFPSVGFVPNYSTTLLLPTVLTLLAPLLNDLIYFVGKKDLLGYIRYFLASVSLYGSLYFISFWSAVKALFGKAVFLVTPKTGEIHSLFSSIIRNRSEIFFGLVLFGISYIINQPWSVILIVMPSILSVSLGILGKKVDHNRHFAISKAYQILAVLILMVGIGVGMNAQVFTNNVRSGQVAGTNEIRDKNRELDNLARQITPQNSVKVKECVDRAVTKADLEKCRELAEGR